MSLGKLIVWIGVGLVMWAALFVLIGLVEVARTAVGLALFLGLVALVVTRLRQP